MLRPDLPAVSLKLFKQEIKEAILNLLRERSIEDVIDMNDQQLKLGNEELKQMLAEILIKLQK